MIKSNILFMVMWVAFAINLYFWVYIFLGVLSLFDLGMRKEFLDLYYLSWVLDGLCIGVVFIWRMCKNYVLALKSFHAIAVIVLVAKLASFLIRWIDYLGNNTGEIFWFEPFLRGSGNLAMLILFIVANYKNVNRVRRVPG